MGASRRQKRGEKTGLVCGRESPYGALTDSRARALAAGRASWVDVQGGEKRGSGKVRVSSLRLRAGGSARACDYGSGHSSLNPSPDTL